MPLSQQGFPSTDDSLLPGHSALTSADWSLVTRVCGLSKRELAIVKLVFDDRCDTEIARALGISRHTVNTHLTRLYRKLDVHSRVQLVVRICYECLLSLR